MTSHQALPQALALAVAAAPWRAVGLSLLGLWLAGALVWLCWRHGAPRPASARALGLGLVGVVLVATVALWSGAHGVPDVAGPGWLVRFDDLLALALADGLPAHKLRAWTWLTHAGDALVLSLLAAAVAAWLWRCGQRRLMLVWLGALAGNGLLTRALKLLVDRQRPAHHHGLLVIESGSSFPSGHASAAVVAWGLLAWLLVRHQGPVAQALSALLAAALVLLVGWSRVLLQVHHASDVVAGWLIGTAWLVGAVLVADFLARRRPAP